MLDIGVFGVNSRAARVPYFAPLAIADRS